MANFCDLRITVHGDNKSIQDFRRLFFANEVFNSDGLSKLLRGFDRFLAYREPSFAIKEPSLERVLIPNYFELNLENLSSTEIEANGWSKWDPPAAAFQTMSALSRTTIQGVFEEELNSCGWFAIDKGKIVEGTRLSGELFYPAYLHTFGEQCLEEHYEMLDEHGRQEIEVELAKGIPKFNRKYPNRRVKRPAFLKRK